MSRRTSTPLGGPPSVDDLPDLAAFVLPQVTMGGYRLRSIGFSDRYGAPFPLVMDITYDRGTDDTDIYEVQAMSPATSAVLLRDCPEPVHTPAGLVCLPVDSDNGRTTFVMIDDFVVRVRSRRLADAQLAEIRDSIRKVTAAQVAGALAESDGNIWEFHQ